MSKFWFGVWIVMCGYYLLTALLQWPLTPVVDRSAAAIACLALARTYWRPA